MSQANELDRAVDQSHNALAAIIRGDVSGYADLYSEQDDITIGNPFGPFARGRENVIATGAAAAARYHDGEIVGFEEVSRHVGDDLACVVEVERFRAKARGGLRTAMPTRSPRRSPPGPFCRVSAHLTQGSSRASPRPHRHGGRQVGRRRCLSQAVVTEISIGTPL